MYSSRAAMAASTWGGIGSFTTRAFSASTSGSLCASRAPRAVAVAEHPILIVKQLLRHVDDVVNAAGWRNLSSSLESRTSLAVARHLDLLGGVQSG